MLLQNVLEQDLVDLTWSAGQLSIDANEGGVAYVRVARLVLKSPVRMRLLRVGKECKH